MRVLVSALLALVLAGPALAARVVFALRDGATHAPTVAGSLRRLDDGLPPAPAAPIPSAVTSRWRLDRSRICVLDLPDSIDVTATLARLNADPNIVWAERDEPRVACVWPGGRNATPVPMTAAPASPSADPLLDDGRQWGLDNLGAAGPYAGTLHADIHARAAWALSRGDAKLVLALTDTGVDLAHPDLAATDMDARPRLRDAFDATLEPVPSADDSLGHGTQVAGVMAARTGEGAHFDSLGIAGVCGGDGGENPGCTLIPIRICAGHSGSASTTDEVRGIEWALDHGARVINLSFAATAPSVLERRAILDAMTRGALVVCAAGNRALDRPGLPMYPAALSGDAIAMSVGASDAWDARASWSSYGPWLDLVAPGVDIWSTALTHPNAFGAPGSDYGTNSGTSFAAPFVAGVAGLMLARRPELDGADLPPLMRADADPLEPAGPGSTTGAGRLDAWRVLADLGPDCAIVHGVAAARVVAIAHDTLTLDERGQPLMDALGSRAAVARLSVRATVPVPESLLAPIRAWVRVAQSSTLRDTDTLGWLAPWGQVSALTADSLTLSGAVFRIEDARVSALGKIDTMTRWLPAPADSASIAYTLWGRVLMTPSAVVTGGVATPRRLACAPDPFIGRTRWSGPPGESIDLFDVSGRRIRTLRLSGAGSAGWDGTDDRGRPVPAGLYLARTHAGSRARVVKLE